MPASSNHGGGHRAGGAGATDACLHACMGIARISGSAQCPDAREVDSMVRHGLCTWCTG